jgi:hypothetical protein
VRAALAVRRTKSLQRHRRSAYLPDSTRPLALPADRIHRVPHVVERGHAGQAVDVPSALLVRSGVPPDPLCQPTRPEGTADIYVEAGLHHQRAQPADQIF